MKRDRGLFKFVLGIIFLSLFSLEGVGAEKGKKPAQRETDLEEARAVYELVKKVVSSKKASKDAKERVFSEWFSLPVSHQVTEPSWIENLLNTADHDSLIAQHVLSQPHWKDYPQWVQTLIDRGEVDRQIAAYVLSQAHWKGYPN